MVGARGLFWNKSVPLPQPYGKGLPERMRTSRLCRAGSPFATHQLDKRGLRTLS